LATAAWRLHPLAVADPGALCGLDARVHRAPNRARAVTSSGESAGNPLLPEWCAEGCAGRRGGRSSRSSAASHPSSCGGERQAENGCSSMAAEDLLGGGATVRAEGRLVALACRGARMLKAATFRFDCDRDQGGCFGRATAQVNSEGSKVSRARCAWEWGARSSGARRIAK
jgi:hypothetical protein